MTVDLEALERLYAAATKGPWTLLHKNGVLEIDDAHPYKTGTAVVHWAGFDSSNKPPKEKLANAQLIVDLVNSFPALLSELRALREAVISADEIAGADLCDDEWEMSLHTWRAEHATAIKAARRKP